MILNIDKIRKTFRGGAFEVNALDGVSLSVSEGELVAVNGPSGCGKTTLLLSAGGLLAPEEGNVNLDGLDLYSASREERAKSRWEKAGFVFQQFYLVPYLDVLENASVPALGDPGARDRAMELITRFNLEDRVHHKPSELSTGERQRTALVRALVNRPKLLLADEPTGNLDDKNAEEVMRAISGFACEGGGVLLVSHDRRTSVHATRNYFMEKGELFQGKEKS